MILTDDQIRIAKEEARRLVAIGIPKWMQADEVQSEAYMILVDNSRLIGATLRLMVRRRLVRFIGRQRAQHIMTASEGTPIDQGSDNDQVWSQLDMELLTERENIVISLIYYVGMTEAETAHALGVDQSRIARIAQGALDKLRINTKAA